MTKQYMSIHWFPRGETLCHYGEYKRGKLSYPIRLISLQIENKAAANETKHNIYSRSKWDVAKPAWGEFKKNKFYRDMLLSSLNLMIFPALHVECGRIWQYQIPQ